VPSKLVVVDCFENVDVTVRGRSAGFLEAFVGSEEPDDLGSWAFDGGAGVLVTVLQFEFCFESTHAFV
jgi:hypothetical protein